MFLFRHLPGSAENSNEAHLAERKLSLTPEWLDEFQKREF